MSAAPDAVVLAGLFGLGRVRGPLAFVARGQSNPLGVWRLHGEGGRCAVKWYARRPDARALRIEIAAFEAGVPMARPLATPDGAYAPPIRIGRNEVFARIWEWVEGDAFEWHTVEPSVSGRVGGLMAAVHRVTPPAVAPEPPSAAPTKSDWRHWAERAQQCALPWARAALRALPALNAHAAFAREARADMPLVLSQRDYHPPNVIAQPDGSLALIDWDAAGLADANADVAQYAFVWASDEDGAVDTDAVRAFVAAYRDAGGRLRQPAVRDFAPASASLLQWIAQNILRDLDDAVAGDPELTLALLEGVRAPDRTELARRVTLLRAA